MNSRERVLTALALKEPDRVPFGDTTIDEGIRKKLMGTEVFNEAEFAKKIGLDMIGIEDYLPPLFCERKKGEVNFVGDGLIKNEKDLDLMVFPDPCKKGYYDKAKRFIEKYGKEDLAIFVAMRPGIFHTIFSMGLTTFSYALYDNIRLVEKIYDRFLEWNCIVAEKLQTIGFDFIVAYDDMAFNSGPFIPPQIFREFFIPKYRQWVDILKLPWAFHSDGNLMPIMDDLLSLGMNAINPIDPAAGMDMKLMKEKYGDKVCLWGNIDMSYTLTRGTPEEVEVEVKQRIKEAAPNGGFILGSANSISDYCKPENVWAMAKAVKKYGKYPINL